MKKGLMELAWRATRSVWNDDERYEHKRTRLIRRHKPQQAPHVEVKTDGTYTVKEYDLKVMARISTRVP